MAITASIKKLNDETIHRVRGTNHADIVIVRAVIAFPEKSIASTKRKLKLNVCGELKC
ncbi:MAG: hypothetical protein ACI845_004407 [Gammaproteobacteria bacterium]|jgi:hypothetical protein